MILNEDGSMSKNKIHSILKIASPLIALLCAVFCALAFGYAFDKGVGYFNPNPLTYIFCTLLGLTVACGIACGITAEKQEASDTLPNRKVMGIILMCSFAFYLVSFLITPKPDYMTFTVAGKLKLDFYHMIHIGANISAAHFGILAFSPKNSLKNVKILTGIAPVITAVLIATSSYFDHSQAINSPIKLLLEFSLAAFALYYILELRLYTPAPRNKLMSAVSIVSIALSLCGGVAMIFQIILYSGFTLVNFATAILLATMASCAASKLLEP